MKKLFTLAASALLASTAWAGVITLDLNKPMNPTTIEYNGYGIWTECYNDADYTWLEFGDENGQFMLSHLIDGEGASWGGYYWDGFTPAIGGDQTDYGQPGSSAAWTTCFGGCMAGGGCVINEDGSVSADPAEPYLVAYYSSWAYEGPSNQVMFVNSDGEMTFEPVGVYVCNHPWPYYGCEHGDGFGRPFAEGDYFELVAHGVAEDGSETTVSMNLVEYTDGQLIAANDWTFFDLSGLGEVTSVYFTLNSTDVGDYGMNTAAYFCMDKFQVKGEDDPVTPELTYPGYWLIMIDEYGNEHPYQLNEGSDGSYTTTVTLGYNPWGEFYWDPSKSDAENEANRPQVPFYYIIDDVVYGAENALQPTAMGEAANTESNPLFAGATEMYTVPVGYSYTLGVYVNPNSDEKYVYCAQGPRTGIDEMNADKTVASVRYFNVAGQEMQQANGVTIMVTTYSDGTKAATKVIK